MSRICAFALALLTPALARAEAVDFQVLHKVLASSGDVPAITVVANEPAEEVAIQLERDDGRQYSFRAGPLKAGQTRRFVLDVPPGPERHFKGEMSVRVAGETRSARFEFNAEIVTTAEIAFDRRKVDLAARRLELTSTRPTARVEIAVTGDQGEDLGVTEIPFDTAPPGTRLPIHWKQADGTVLKIAVRVHDPDGFYSGVELYPWRLDIPHEEVHFATGSSRIEASEEPKLDKSLALIRHAVARYGRFADLKLFVAGHTDTVGKAETNRTLSLERARAISAFFRRKGLRIPVLYEGFGEDALKVPTPDETDEIENRRAEYILAVEPPVIRDALGQSGWKRLR